MAKEGIHRTSDDNRPEIRTATKKARETSRSCAIEEGSGEVRGVGVRRNVAVRGTLYRAKLSCAWTVYMRSEIGVPTQRWHRMQNAESGIDMQHRKVNNMVHMH